MIKDLKKRAREILFSNYRVFLFGTLFFTAVFLGSVLLLRTFCEILCADLIAETARTVYLTFDIVFFILLYPFMLGYISMCFKVTSRQNGQLSDMLIYYSTTSALRSCYAFLICSIPQMLLRIALPAGIVIAAQKFLPVQLDRFVDTGYETVAYAISGSFFMFECVGIAVILILSGRLILSVMDFCCGTKQKYTFSEKRAFLSLRLSLIPLYVLSVLSFGILLTAYALPFTITLYSLFALGKKNDTDMLGKTREFESLSDTAIFDNNSLRNES